jgi:hypothetical protein
LKRTAEQHWDGGLVRMASALGDSRITKRFAEAAAH